MSPITTGKDFYDFISKDKCGLDFVTINEVKLDDYLLNEELLLDNHNIEHDEIIKYFDMNKSSSNYGCNVDDVKGWAINYTHNDLRKSAIFVVSPPPYGGDIIDDREELLFPVLKSITLLHELGHAHDFQYKKTLNDEGENIDLSVTEGYADIFALKYLKTSINNPIYKLALNIYSKSILERSRSTEFYRSVHKHINKKILDSTLRKWAKII